MRIFLTILLALSAVGLSAETPTVPSIVAQKCTGCHPAPRPGAMPRHAWPRINATMVRVMEEAGIPYSAEEQRFVEDYYVANSPLTLATIPDDFAEPNLSFEKRSVGLTSPDERPEVTSVKFCDIDGDGVEDDLIVTDNVLGSVSWLRDIGDDAWLETTIAKVPAPVNSTAFDFDGDGDTDLGISAMGYMHPNDEMIGEFHLLLNNGDGTFAQQILVEGTPRITDCAPADYDGDGDIDFVLAMFGWRYTGGIGYLEQTAPGEFSLRTLVEINGAMRVIANDANGDGFPDFMAMMTQQHESIFQFTSNGDGTFANKQILQANHPAFGSSSLHLADLDGDGDEDILYTNGDMMDENPEPKPYHGARWLENDGAGGYTLHALAGMPGCYDAKPIDMDGDGDLDVVIAALYFQWDVHDFPSLAWLENTGDFESFIRRKIAYDPSNLANIAVGDANGDGKPDIIGGGMHVPGPIDRVGRLTLWLGE